MRRIRLNGVPVSPYAPGVDWGRRAIPGLRTCSFDVWIERCRSPVVPALCARFAWEPVLLAGELPPLVAPER
ncbi:MAG TPA: hypothetical protein VF461_01140 [Gemmatimonadaceae bacterium]